MADQEAQRQLADENAKRAAAARKSAVALARDREDEMLRGSHQVKTMPKAPPEEKNVGGIPPSSNDTTVVFCGCTLASCNRRHKERTVSCAERSPQTCCTNRRITLV